MKRKKCCDCGKVLSKDEVALTRKLIDLDSENYYCIDCMAEFLGCEPEDLRIKIAEFKEQGCTLFL